MTRLTIDAPLRWLAGGMPGAIRPLPPFHPSSLSFLSDLSAVLMADPAARRMADVQTFAFWCRKANLNRLATSRDDRAIRLGRGLVFHVAPSNVPVNFAFSLAFGLLAGNGNVVRAASKDSAAVDVICAALAQVMARPHHGELAGMNGIVRYDADSDWTARLSARADGRVLWGGDRTIASIRTHPLPPRAVEMTFPDRYSLCVMNADPVAALDDAALARLAEGFYNDTYLMDQNACSSPHLVIWLGCPEAKAEAGPRFWAALSALAASRYALAPVQAVDKLTRLLCAAIENQPITGVRRYGAELSVIRLSGLPADMEDIRGQSGLFWEVEADDLTALAPVVTGRFQTLCQFGLESERLRDFVIENRLPGIDRIVPVGHALDMDVIWDGFDIIGHLSRIIDAKGP